MRLFNTMSRKKEEFVPLEEGKVRMYVCGPTVYNLIHIGNARPMIIFDTVRRYLEYKGYEVNYVSNFTDVDDKIIKKAIEEGVSAEEISQRYIAECKKDMAGMNVKDFWTFIEANDILDRLYRLSKMYDKMNAQEQIVFLSEAEKVFSAFERVPNEVWEEEYLKYKQVLDTYKNIRMLRWAEAR